MANKKTTSKKTTSKKTTAKKTSVKKSNAKKTSSKSKKKTTKKTISKKTTPEKKSPKESSSPDNAKEEKELTEEEIKEKEKEERIDSFKKAGDIAKKVKEYIKPKIKVGMRVIDLIDEAEQKIVELGGKAGFPVNISINHIAAHYSSPPGDTTTINEGDVVKFDMGVHIDGYCVDTAFTVSFNKDPELKDLIKSAEEAVDVAIKLMKPTMKTNHIGNEIEKTIKKYGFKPIRELTGHKISRWDLHAGKSIPCIATPPGTGDEIEKGEVYAIEVFSSNGDGSVHAQNNCHIYQINPGVRRIPLRMKSARKMLSFIANEFQTLPFSKFQINKEFPKSIGLFEIIKSKKLIEHNVLSDRKGCFIAQQEHTVLITKDGCEILT
ncbi:MAG: type II methionyl aminopeptidase [archaeon]|nr:type II methionyl aminopeptidase [archaeon]